MTTTQNRKIKTFYLEGELLDDSVIISTKDIAERTIKTDMRDKGYVPVLDIDPIWSVEYNAITDQWFFEISMHGFYAGKRKAWQYQGWSQGKMIPRPTPPATSNQ
jgi:hypothetical protein